MEKQKEELIKKEDSQEKEKKLKDYSNLDYACFLNRKRKQKKRRLS